MAEPLQRGTPVWHTLTGKRYIVSRYVPQKGELDVSFYSVVDATPHAAYPRGYRGQGNRYWISENYIVAVQPSDAVGKASPGSEVPAKCRGGSEYHKSQREPLSRSVELGTTIEV